MKLLTAKFTSKCHKTGEKINKGELMYYDYKERKVYCKRYIDDLNEAYSTKQFIEAQENSYFDKFISLNYSNENK
jgi:SUMO ligase MMS21 Smc5/6 complex component